MFSRVQAKEKFSFYSHLFPALFFTGITIYMAPAMAPSWQGMTALLIYGSSAVFMFCASALYHAFKTQENGTGLLRRLDHFAIYVMIAGSYTVICWLYVDQPLFSIIVTLQWLMVGAGVYFKIIRMNTPRIISTVIYLAMGWMIIFTIKPVVSAMSSIQFFLLVAGGVSYTIGTLFYALKRPVLIPERFGFHEIFHIFIVGGALLHLALVYIGYQL